MRKILRTTDPSDPLTTLRILSTTCPRCKEHVQFVLNGDEYIYEEIEDLEERLKMLFNDNAMLKKTIKMLIRKDIL